MGSLTLHTLMKTPNSSLSLMMVSLIALGASSCGSSAGVDERDAAIKAATIEFEVTPGDKRFLSPGPCIAESVPGLPDWAVDIAHDPREPVDDDPANQCQSFRDGETHHFVELTPEGKLIRAQ